MTGKECLERLKSMPTCSECELYGSCFDKPLCNELYNTIEKDLDRLEKLEKENQTLNQTIQTIRQNARNDYVEFEILKDCIKDLTNICNEFQEENAKLKKAIEILKEKLDISIFDVFINITINQKTIKTHHLTQQEYELLKEVIENE